MLVLGVIPARFSFVFTDPPIPLSPSSPNWMVAMTMYVDPHHPVAFWSGVSLLLGNS